MKKIISILTTSTLLLLVSFLSKSDAVFLKESSLKEIKVQPPTFIKLHFKNNYITSTGDQMQIIPYMAEYITAENTGEIGNTVFLSQGANTLLGADFVQNNTFLSYTDGSNDITYYVDDKRPSEDMLASSSHEAISRAMNTWDEVTSSKLGITERPYHKNIKTGIMAGILGFGEPINPISGWVADIVHAGWISPEFFDFLAPGGSKFILSATFTFIVVINGEYSDADNNGKADVWFREIYYNDNFDWNNGSKIDVETVALHEAGHGLSRGHFGKTFGTYAYKKIHFSPRAIMNSSYSGTQTDIDKPYRNTHPSLDLQLPNN